MQSAQPNSDTPKPCAGGCGFFGSAPLNYYCSVCFKKAHGEEEFKRRLQMTEKAPPAPAPVASEASESNVPEPKMEHESTASCISEVAMVTESAGASVAAKAEEVAEPSPKKPATNRCFQCNKKVGLTGFGCRCGNTFCPVHRYSDKHSCPFDYKAAGREEIKTANPVVNAEKVARI